MSKQSPQAIVVNENAYNDSHAITANPVRTSSIAMPASGRLALRQGSFFTTFVWGA
jgi:hypothetical protein